MELQIIQSKIIEIRGFRIMLDRDLALLYGVETKQLNQAVKRNIERFPVPFRFQISDNELNELVTICDRFKILKHTSSNPYAFTEQGVAMLSAVLKSKTAIKVSIEIMNAFVNLRQNFQYYRNLNQRIDNLEDSINTIFDVLEELSTQKALNEKPPNPIGFQLR